MMQIDEAALLNHQACIPMPNHLLIKVLHQIAGEIVVQNYAQHRDYKPIRIPLEEACTCVSAAIDPIYSSYEINQIFSTFCTLLPY